MENQKRHSRKLLSILLVLCMVLTIVPITAFAAGVNYINKISVTYTAPNYKAGDAPQAVASVTEGECSVAYEYWREIEQKTEGSVWTGTGRYWYSDSSKMSSLAADKQITQFEAGHHYSYNIVLKTNSGYFISDDTIVSVGDHEWGKAGSQTNLEIKELSTELRIYSPYSIDLPAASTDEVITTVDIGNVWKNLDSSQPVAFTAEVNPNSECANQMMLTDEYWQQVAIDGSRIAKSNPQKPIAGETYCYAVKLTAKDGYYFHDGFKGSGVECDVICDGSTTTAFAGTLSDDRKQLILWFNDIKVTATDGNSQDIDVIEINNATITFKDGDKPVFTGDVPDNEDYAFRCEWWSLDENTGIVSTEPEWGGDIYNNKITVFEAGKTYHYGVYVTAYYGNFSPDAKLKINGQYVNYKRVGDDDNMQSMWLETDLTMTPTAAGDSDYKIIEGANGIWTQNSDGTLTFRANGDFSKFTGVKVDGTLIDAKNYTAVSGSTVITLKADYLKTLSVGTHKLMVVYTDGECSTNYEIKATQTENGISSDPEKAPQTGDNSNIPLWFALMALSVLGISAAFLYGRKRKVIC